MFIKKLLIKNYRCFDNNAKVIEFSKSGLTALIGPNNVGKSTVLKALDILLGDKWPTSHFSIDDFNNNNIDKPIIIACEYFSPISMDIYGASKNISGTIISVRHLNSGYGESSLDIEYNLIESITDFNNERWTLVCYKTPIKVSRI